jgi:hypothetical protein
VYGLARIIQFLGLVVAGSALFVGFLGHDARRELIVLGIGACLFFAGRGLQKGFR